MSWNVEAIRAQFPGLRRLRNGSPVVFLDGPAGSQVPAGVIEAIADYLSNTNANHGGVFVTSRESDVLLEESHRAAADFVGAEHAHELAFGANMTTLTFAFSRALARTWKPGDEIIVTQLDHDANVQPWVRAAADVGVTVHRVPVEPPECRLDLNTLRRFLSARTRLVAVGCASNATGTINPVAQIARWAHEAGAQVFLDAVHLAPHALLDVRAWDCDYLVCSAYKFFGPHVGLLYGRAELLSALDVYKVRPAPDQLPDRWETGTQNHEGIAGVLAAIEYLADLGRAFGRPGATRREALRLAFQAITDYEATLAARFLQGLATLPQYRLYGIADRSRLAERVPTFSFVHATHSSRDVATHLANQGIFVWHGNYYALSLTEQLGLEPGGMVRVGFLHYNTAEEVDRLLRALAELA